VTRAKALRDTAGTADLQVLTGGTLVVLAGTR